MIFEKVVPALRRAPRTSGSKPVHWTLAAFLIAGLAVPASAQDAQSLIARNLEARGGAAALSAIKAIRFEGRTIYPGDFELSYKLTRARAATANSVRVDLMVQGLNVVQAYDGTSGWKINPFQGRKDPEKMSSDEAREMADFALIDGPLLSARTDGSRVEALGREDFDGTLAYKLKVTQKDGDEFTYWLDPDTFLEIKIDETRKARGAENTTESELGDYEKVAGVYFPMSIESWALGAEGQRQRTIIASGQADPPIAAGFFSEPGVSGAPRGGEPPDAAGKPRSGPLKSKPSPAAKPAVAQPTLPKGK